MAADYSVNASFEYDLFLSYANADRAWVQGYLIPALGVPRECLITHDDFRLGAPRVSEIERAITTSRYSVLILSPAYLTDEWSNLSEQLVSHLTTAEQAVRLVPLLKSECELPLRIDFRVRLDCTDPANWERETARLRDLLNQPAPQPERITCPYPGMIPFRVEDARWFYGRAKEIDELVRRIRVQNFLFVIGPSGSGKSSLVFAGLIVELNKRQPDTWLVKTLRPGSDPLAALESTTQPPNHPTTLLVIDQFEELFTQSDKPTQAAFIARLQSLRAENRCTFVVTMRADFYPDLMNSDLWPLDPSERVEIAPLRGAALAEAIAKPAEQVGVYLEAGLVERLLADAADEPGVLPLVQETMVLLWDKRERRLLPLRAYAELGQGNLSGLAVAIATRADAVFARLAESERKIARRIFLRLVQFGEGRADTRRQQRVSGLRASGDDPNEFDRTLKHLTDNRLLTLTGEENDADRQVDIAHEALIAGWQRFRQWVNERREAEQTRRRLEDKAREWVRLGRGSAGLLDEVELKEASDWLQSADAAELGYDATLSELVETSRHTLDEARREKEETQQRELAQARKLAEEQRQRAEERTRTARRLRVGAMVLAVVAVLAVIAAGVAVLQTQQAQIQEQNAKTQARLSESRRLAAQSGLRREQDLALAYLLGVQATKTDDTFEARNNLFTLVNSSPRPDRFLWGHTDGVYSVAFSPDGKTLASGSRDNTILLWDVTRGERLREFKGHTSLVYNVAFSPDGKTLASGSRDNTILLWDVSSGQRLQELKGHTR